jgi:hypothetical protein
VLLTGKGHDYRKGDILPFRREADDFGGDRWCVVDERRLDQEAAIERFEAVEKAKAEAAKKSLNDGEPYLAEGEVGDDRELLRVVGPERKGN